MFFRKSKLIESLRAEIARLREMLARTEGERDNLKQGYDGMREIAAKAIDVAKARCSWIAPTGQQCEDDTGHTGRHRTSRIYQVDDVNAMLANDMKYLSDYKAPVEKHCPECNVSVRSESWPQECPACFCTFGFTET